MLVNTGKRYLRTVPSQNPAVYPATARREWRSCVLHVILEDIDHPKHVPEYFFEVPRRCVVHIGRWIDLEEPSEELECSLLRHLEACPFELVDDCIGQSFELLSLESQYTYCSTADSTACSR